MHVLVSIYNFMAISSIWMQSVSCLSIGTRLS